ncbi:MAG: amidohydrolase family protein [Candidatus Methanoperedenaceae archaeon]|nr:amidohydrolase family protein [Candidatus Methanoperedenaceae archaeon]
MADLIIKRGHVITINGGVIDNGVIVVDNGIITHVGKDTKEKADRVIDAKGCAVLPGLVNAHTHVSMTLLRGAADNFPFKEWLDKIQQAEMKLTPRCVRAGAYLGVLEMIKSGTTAFADMYFHMDEVAEVVRETGIRASLGYGMIEGMNEEPEVKLKNRAEFNLKWNGAATSRISTMYAPHSPLSCSKEFLLRVKEQAARDGTGIHIHVLETEDELGSMKEKYGMCSVNLLDSIGMLDSRTIAAHCIWLSDGDIELLKNRNVNVAHCPTSNMALGVGTAPVPKMLDKGVNVALGTDGAASSGSLDMWNEMRAASAIHKSKGNNGITPRKLLEMATVNGAKALDINAGVLKPGCCADIIIVDTGKLQLVPGDIYSALVYGVSGFDVRTTIVDGKILMEDYEVKVLEEEKVIEGARKAALKIDGDN